MHCQTERTSDANAPPVTRELREPENGRARCDAAITVRPPSADIADRRLLTAMASGSRSALARLHSHYFSRLVRFFVHLMPLSAPEVVDDLIADTLFEVWRQCATFASDSSVHVAIMRVAWGHASRCLANSEARRASPEALRPGSRADLHCRNSYLRSLKHLSLPRAPSSTLCIRVTRGRKWQRY
jgi:hypothetical protein